ncbi:MAG: intradiol ring-cleavage dioxygenase [Planctomycetales bacterium]|nr:intradiol ring-cleavage dioxygenase [Planctomycetales bacterium]
MFTANRLPRRHFLASGLVAAGAAWATPGLYAEMLQTATLTEGPFYPDKLPLDTDNDLLIINDSITPAVGEITHLSGRVLTKSGSPVRNALVEIWQVDANANYLHSRGATGVRDGNFQGYGRFLTDSKGNYYFRTIKPVVYPGRTPHIHIAVNSGGRRLLTTQMLINCHPQNSADGVFRTIRDPLARETVLGVFKPLEGSKIGELAVNFDLVLGVTAFEDESGRLRGAAGRN